MSNVIVGLVLFAAGTIFSLSAPDWGTVVIMVSGAGLFGYGLHEYYVKKGWV